MKCVSEKCPFDDVNPKCCPYVGGCDFAKFEMTNADHIRAMTDEELAEWLVLRTVYAESAWSTPSYLNFLTCTDDTFENALKGTTKWLKQPAEV